MNSNAGTVVLDLDGVLMAGRGRRLRRVQALADVPGDKWVISDFDGAEPAVVTVEAKAAFAASVAEQELRRTGELETGGSFFAHRVRRRGDRASEVFGTVAPAGVQIQRESELQSDEDCVLTFPVGAAFAAGLESLSPRRPVAMVLLRERQVDVLVGDRNRTYGAFRSTAARGAQGVDNLAANVSRELSRIQRETGIKVDEIRWGFVLGDASASVPAWVKALAIEIGVKCRALNAARLRVDGKTFDSVLPPMVSRLGASGSASPRTQINLWRMNQALPRVAMALLVLTGFAGWNVYNESTAVARMNAEIGFMEGALNEPDQVATFDPTLFDERLALAESLVQARAAPPLREVIGDVAAAVEGRDTYLRDLNVEYAPEAVTLSLVGQTNKRGGADPMPTYTAFMDAMRAQGYVLVESDLDTGTAALTFSTRLSRGLGNE